MHNAEFRLIHRDERNKEVSTGLRKDQYHIYMDQYRHYMDQYCPTFTFTPDNFIS